MEWKPIETAPKDGKWILLYDPKSIRLVHAGCWDPEFETTFTYGKTTHRGAWTAYQAQSFHDEEYAELHPTMWMPLPEPPKEDAK